VTCSWKYINENWTQNIGNKGTRVFETWKISNLFFLEGGGSSNSKCTFIKKVHCAHYIIAYQSGPQFSACIFHVYNSIRLYYIQQLQHFYYLILLDILLFKQLIWTKTYVSFKFGVISTRYNCTYILALIRYNGYRVFRWVKRPGCGVDHPPPNLAPRLQKE